MPLFSSSLASPSPFLPKPHLNQTQSPSTTDPPPRVRIPNAPWMTTPPPPLLPSDDHLSDTSSDDPSLRRSLSKRIRNGRTRKVVFEIIKSVKSLQKSDQIEEKFEGIGEWDEEVEEEEEEEEEERPNLPWIGGKSERDGEILVFRREKKKREITEADKRIAPAELRRLRIEGSQIKRWIKAWKAGITAEVVEEIKRTWRFQELAMVKIVDPLKRNMDRAREIAEAKTGGLVVLTKKDSLIIYRVNKRNYHLLSKTDELKEEKPITKSLYEREADRLLNSLGPRFIDWWWRGPEPVDADLLPEVVPGFKTPFRRLPPYVRPTLSDDELTWLRFISRPLPTHFALGRNRKLQGLAEAIIKLWEKSLVAKIAIKVGMYTDHAQMASELKRLTGGVVILRNKDFIILYRGKDFVTEKVVNQITDRENKLFDEQNIEEEARLKALRYFQMMDRSVDNSDCIGSFKEFQDIKMNYLEAENEKCEDKIKLEAEKLRLEKELKDQERKLFILRKKIERSEREMTKLKALSGPLMPNSDIELLTEEERSTLRSIGLKMEKHLLLGRRGVYDGVIGSVHQHWKHKEVVKVITKQTGISQITYTAKLLELMTGGALVAVENVRSHHVIIIYRGKNYRRPMKLLPDNLLNKKEALRRSIEAQRRGSLKYFARQREKSVEELKQRLGDLEEELKTYIQ
ncbi:maize chloroplast splicing factor-like protein isoform X1 [Carex rostrata]